MVIDNKDILDAVNRVSDQVTRVDEKADRTNVRLDSIVVRMDTLVETTNHRMQAFTDALELKADTSSLLVNQARNSKLFLAGIAVIFTALVPVVTDHWQLLYERWPF